MERPKTLRVPLKTAKNKNKPDGTAVINLLFNQLDIALVRLMDVASGFVAICHKEEDLDKMASQEATNVLKTINLEVKIPPQIISQRSVICRQIDQWVGGHTPDEIKEQLEKNHVWAKDNIKEVIKFRDHTHIFKIIFCNTTAAVIAMEKGLLLFNMSITKDQIERETFINVQMCFSCYEMETHIQKDCPNKEQVICSECAGNDHTWRSCKSEEKKCINCGGPHRTLAMGCPKKKEVINKKKQEMKLQEETKKNTNYAQIAKAAVKETNQNKTIIKIQSETSLKITTCILFGHISNINQPGSFSNETNKMLKMNNLPEMVFPNNPSSEVVMGIQFDKESVEQNSIINMESEETVIKTKNSRSAQSPPEYTHDIKRKKQRQSESEFDDESEKNSHSENNETPLVIIPNKEEEKQTKKNNNEQSNTYKYDGKNLNIKIYTPTNKPFPRNASLTALVNGIKEKKYKYDYEATSLSEEEVQKEMYNTQIKIPLSCRSEVAPAIYTKIINGRNKLYTADENIERKKERRHHK